MSAGCVELVRRSGGVVGGVVCCGGLAWPGRRAGDSRRVRIPFCVGFNAGADADTAGG